MPGFFLYVSNRLEILKGYLAQVVAEPLQSPFESEIIVVQSKGMERWLTQELAQQAGIWANAQFPFPNTMAWDIFQRTVSDIGDDRLFTPEVMTWRILHLLQTCLDRPGFESLKNYLGSESNDLKNLQLCTRIADVFDRYTVYRPDMLLQWQKGGDQNWQAQLWRALTAEYPAAHRAAIRQTFLDAVRAGHLRARHFPARISIFGMSSLPPFYLEIFLALARFLQVHLFFMNPSREYWETIVSPKRIAKIRSNQSSSTELEPPDDYLEVGNSLLASLGKMGKDFLGMLIDQEGGEETACFEDPGEETLLNCLQSDILNLRDRGEEEAKTTLKSGEDSIQIHCCHSPLREIEVLHDRLLDLFERDPGLTPNDILVMTPNIEAYAPFVAAVFAGKLEENKRIPFSIADRSAKTESQVAQSFLKILGLKNSRLGVDEVMDVLESRVVQRRFDFQAEDLEQILRWVKETHIRWGIDGDDRKRQGLPGFKDNSWRWGLERLLLGYALPEEDDRLFGDILPFDDVEGASAQTLGHFAEFVHQLFATVEELKQARTLQEWSETLQALLSGFIAADEEVEMEVQLLSRQIQELRQIQKMGQFDQPIDLEAVRYVLERRLTKEELRPMFLGGGVTFCAMLPMRSIPAKVVALLGLSAGAFPRSNSTLAFDLMSHSPLKGDRSLRDEDRYLFLEALLSARDHFYISYVGQSLRDNSQVPPSVLVSELLDVINRGFQAGSSTIEDEILIRHPLQAFSPAYFKQATHSAFRRNTKDENSPLVEGCRGGSPSSGKTHPLRLKSSAPPQEGTLRPENKLFSFSKENYDACQVLMAQRTDLAPFVAGSIGAPPAEWRRIDINRLKSFFRNPARFFCRQRLGLNLSDNAAGLDNREPFSLDALEAYQLKQSMLKKQLEGKELSTLYQATRQRGMMPPEKPGEVAFENAVAEVESFASTLRPFVSEEPLEPIEFDFEVGGFHLSGRLESLWTNHLLHYRCASIKPNDYLSIWIDHLILNCQSEKGYPSKSILIATNDQWLYAPIAEPRKWLQCLLDYFWEGLSEPLPFFPETSFEYAARSSKGTNPREALAGARQKWEKQEFGGKGGESEDAYHHLVFGRVEEPLDERFCKVALDIFGPLLRHQQPLGTR